MPHPEYERAELVHLCTVITRSNRPPSHAESAGSPEGSGRGLSETAGSPQEPG
jgi:hypothetical protein